MTQIKQIDQGRYGCDKGFDGQSHQRAHGHGFMDKAVQTKGKSQAKGDPGKPAEKKGQIKDAQGRQQHGKCLGAS